MSRRILPIAALLAIAVVTTFTHRDGDVAEHGTRNDRRGYERK